MTIVKVQDCGCIALPEDVITATGLHPGATLSIDLASDGKTALLTPVTPLLNPPPTAENARCG